MQQEEAAKRLAEKFGVSLDRARAALILAEGDLLDAAQLLERESDQAEQKVSAYSTAAPAHDPAPAAGTAEGWNAERVWTLIKGIFLHPVANRLEVRYPGGGQLDIPALVVCLGVLVAFWITVIALGAGWVLGCHFALRGPEVDIPQANDFLDRSCALMAKWRKGLGL